MSSKCPANMLCAAAFWMCTRPKPTGRRVLSSLGTKSNPSASSIPQRSAPPIRWMKRYLLPLTETPVREDILNAHSRPAFRETNHGVRRSRRASGPLRRCNVFPGWEFYAPVAGADRSVFDLLDNALVMLTNQKAVKAELDHTWSRIEEAHERSEIGNLVLPTDLYLLARHWWSKIGNSPRRGFRAPGYRAQ